MMAFLRFLLTFIVAGALVGVLAVTVAFPRYMAWDNTPSMGKALCDCGETTRQTANKLINAQMTGCAAGAGVGALAGVLLAFSRRQKKKAALGATSAAIPPAK
jgi:hypothetical protein